ncbi:hypothetical protein [Streptomyces albipurpureus]|uniref:Uncharacterized protein n=1 Tax=Streptomyces albipurpureus TaxID=2897419 RepID=A0ABT0V0F3_9ACTN|nr:hypothetical protein [Streptomyces sp. CWNU-1]MCM2394317.1 hypothetical protein [Streptomyces sp. CWNU-1]
MHTVATRKPSAIAPLVPVVQTLSGSSVDELAGYIEKAGAAKTGDAVVTDSGNVAAVRLKLDGDGDAYLLVGLGEGTGAQTAISRSATSPQHSRARCSKADRASHRFRRSCVLVRPFTEVSKSRAHRR